MHELSEIEIRSHRSQDPRNLDPEVERIRSVFARREYRVPKDRYSLFKEENLLRNLELQREIIRTLRRFQHTKLEQETVLDVGCGEGFWLRYLVQWGARPENLFGIDLREEKINQGRTLCPRGINLQCGDASKLAFQSATFDLILQFTVFTSILDPSMRKNLAGEMCRVLKPGGAILWYDYFVSNPNNPDARGVTRKEIPFLFPGLSIFLKRITLAPPLGRAIAPVSPSFYRFLSTIKPLCKHYLGFLQKP